MTGKSIGSVVLCLATVCTAQTPNAVNQASNVATHHYRLTFTVSAHGNAPAQDYVLNVSVSAGKPGLAELNVATGEMGDTLGREQQAFQASDVQETAEGLKAKVEFVSPRRQAQAPGLSEPLTSEFRFEQQVTIPLNRPTRITRESTPKSLDGKPLTSPPPPLPQITLTVAKL